MVLAKCSTHFITYYICSLWVHQTLSLPIMPYKMGNRYFSLLISLQSARPGKRSRVSFAFKNSCAEHLVQNLCSFFTRSATVFYYYIGVYWFKQSITISQKVVPRIVLITTCVLVTCNDMSTSRAKFQSSFYSRLCGHRTLSKCCNEFSKICIGCMHWQDHKRSHMCKRLKVCWFSVTLPLN